MAKYGEWPDNLETRLKKHWKDAKNNRDEFKKLVLEDKVLMKQKSWNACRLKAGFLSFFKNAKPSQKKYPFSQLEETKKQELLKLLADGNVGWTEVFQKFPGFSELQFKNFAKNQSTGVNKKKKEISPEEFKKNVGKYTDRALKFLREFGPANADKISDEIEISAQMVFRVVEELARRGYQVVKDPDGRFRLSTSEAKTVATEHHWRPTTRILIWSGAELGGIGQQADLLKTVYHTIVPEEKPDFVIALGNVIVGNLSAVKRNETFLELEQEYEEDYKKKKKISELLYQAQIDYILNVIGDEAMTCLPSHRCNTYFISGLKEQSFIKQGFEDPLENICDQRRELKGAKHQDWFYFGRNMHMFRIINTGKPVGVLALTSKKNPFRGAYTRGYRPRKTSTSIAGWLINTLRTKGVNDYPRVIIWTDGVGVYTALGDSEASTFISLPKLAVTDPTELELDTPPNLGCVIVDLTFNEHGELKQNGIEWKFRNLAPYINERGY
ncbi:MAG: hypothetical protein HYX20_00300 [Candidatus Yanofskybacteria bacterium]|nr:hypothetical protein [Candidatus Yanofskybacteria bacterium]